MNRSERATVLRILSHYRRLVLLGKARLPLDEGRRLLGPDCAYHLYFRHDGGTRSRRRSRRTAGKP